MRRELAHHDYHFYDLSFSRIKPRKVFTHACARLHARSLHRRRRRRGEAGRAESS